MEYLGQSIEVLQQPHGWMGVWYHPACMVQLGYFPTAQMAWEAVAELVRRDLAGQSLCGVVQEWREQGFVSRSEQDLLEASLFQYVFDES
jgi:hypothetical protein